MQNMACLQRQAFFLHLAVHTRRYGRFAAPVSPIKNHFVMKKTLCVLFVCVLKYTAKIWITFETDKCSYRKIGETAVFNDKMAVFIANRCQKIGNLHFNL